jgi:hypothetical protein
MENIVNPFFYVELCPFSSSLVTYSDSNNLVAGNLGNYYCQSPEILSLLSRVYFYNMSSKYGHLYLLKVILSLIT